MILEDLYAHYATSKCLSQEEIAAKIRKWRQNMVHILREYYVSCYITLQKTFAATSRTTQPSPISGTQRKSQKRQFRWTAVQHAAFLEALQRFGRDDISAITEFVGSGVTERQVRSHLSKWLLSQRRKLAATPERLPRFPHS